MVFKKEYKYKYKMRGLGDAEAVRVAEGVRATLTKQYLEGECGTFSLCYKNYRHVHMFTLLQAR